VPTVSQLLNYMLEEDDNNYGVKYNEKTKQHVIADTSFTRPTFRKRFNRYLENGKN